MSDKPPSSTSLQTGGHSSIYQIIKHLPSTVNRLQMSLLFGREVKTIGKHISNVSKEELSNFPVVAKFATTAVDYRLDIVALNPKSREKIITVGKKTLYSQKK